MKEVVAFLDFAYLMFPLLTAAAAAAVAESLLQEGKEEMSMTVRLPLQLKYLGRLTGGTNAGGKIISASQKTPTRSKSALVFHSCIRNVGALPLCGERNEHQTVS